jgi:hypothetical protein
MALQGQVRTIGGQWNKPQQVWLVPYGCIAGTKLEKLIVETTLDAKKNGSLSDYLHFTFSFSKRVNFA